MRALIIVGVSAALAGAAGGAGLSAAFVERGPQGPRGEQGEVGPEGPAGADGSTEGYTLDWEEVWQAIADDPEQFAQIVNDSLDPDPEDVQSNVDTLSTALDDLCSTLSSAAALEDEFISCP